MTDEEYELACSMLPQGRRGTGLRAVAAEISKRRGATTLNPAANVRKGVSEAWVRRQIAARERDKTVSATKPAAPSESDAARQNSFDVEDRRTEHQTAPKGGPDRKENPDHSFADPLTAGEAARGNDHESEQGVQG